MNKKTILILVECLPSALRAGKYVFQNLYDNNTEVILLQAYKIPKFGHLMTRDFTSKLNEIALEDLSVLKDSFIKEFGVNPEQIIKVTREGDLNTIVEDELKNLKNPLLILGAESSLTKKKITNKQILSFIKNNRHRPTILIDDNITLIDKSKILFIAENIETYDEHKALLIDISERDNTPMEYYIGNKSSYSIPSDINRFFIKDTAETSNRDKKVIYLDSVSENA